VVSKPEQLDMGESYGPDTIPSLAELEKAYDELLAIPNALSADETLDLLANLKVAATICESYVPDMKTHERLRHYIDKLGGG